MGQPAAKQGDRIMAVDMHANPLGVPTPLPFAGILNAGLCNDVKIMGKPAAVVGSVATNTPPHPPPFMGTNQGTITIGSATVRINGKPAARMGDVAVTCGDAGPVPGGQVVGSGNVMIG